jgi:hypothetical protein
MLKPKLFFFSVLILTVVTTAFFFRRNEAKFPANPYPFKEHRAFDLPLNNPDTVSAKEAVHMRDNDLVFGIEVNGHARAYPRWIMLQYHVANDTIDNSPVLLSQCEVCSSAAAFVPTLENIGYESLSFNLCGIHAGTFSICDNQTTSNWHPFTGVAFSGPLKGRHLKRIPVVTKEWRTWKMDHPNTDVVFASNNLKKRPHSAHQTVPGDPFLPYYFKPTVHSDSRLPANELVFGLASSDGTATAIPLREISPDKPYFPGNRNTLVIRYDAFAVAAFTVNGNEKFSIKQKHPLLLRNESGGEWDEFGKPTAGSKVKADLQPADGRMSEWYEWVSSYPNSTISPGNHDLR